MGWAFGIVMESFGNFFRPSWGKCALFAGPTAVKPSDVLWPRQFCRGLFLRKKGVFSFLMLISTFLP